LSDDLLAQAARRLRILALLYAFTFFMAAFFPMLLFPSDRARMLANEADWVPGVVSIAVALAVAALACSRRMTLHGSMALGLAFEIVSSYGIAFAEFLDAGRLSMHGYMGLSWVAVWVSVFTVVVPTPPRRTALAALAAVSAVPVVIAFAIHTNRATYVPDPVQFFFWLVFPYLLVVLMAYVGAHVVYGLGKEVSRARELGSYQLTERLGHGGMGDVWRAKHRLLARPAAIKLIRPADTDRASMLSNEDAKRRFEREAQVTARLRSPHTVELFDFGVTDDGAFYYVMELLEGFTLETLVTRFGPVLPERAIYLVR
jgi:serine/threonine-protein kinase